tara:strand:+ start:1306 stop:1923 length:618 start_codon:yes stop_codon:yes gene_type:complete
MFLVIRNLYNWVLNFSHKTYSLLALFILSFAESSFFPIPPDALLIALCLGARHRSFYFALVATFGSVLGGVAGYCIGHYLWWSNDVYSSFANFFFNNVPGFSEELFLQIQNKYNLYGFLIIFTAGFTPVPYKIFTISSGAFDISFYLFLIASITSRGGRFLIVSFLMYMYGERIRVFIDKYFNLISIIFVIFLILGIFLLSLFKI